MPVHINNNRLLDKYRIIWTKIEDLKNIELDVCKFVMIDI